MASWKDIPDSQKESTGLWVQDYGGYMSIGYDSSKVPAITSVNDLTKPAFKGKVALNGDPTKANAALNGVMMAGLSQGGTLDDISKGVDFFHTLKQDGNFVPVQATTATVKNGTTPVVFDWDYLSASHGKDVPTWKIFVPSNAVLGGYYAQAINKQAPHPAAARLWEEYLYSVEGQNLWLKGGARPVEMAAMTTAGTIDAAAAAALPQVSGRRRSCDRPGDGGQRLPGRELGEGDQLVVTDIADRVTDDRPARGGRRLPVPGSASSRSWRTPRSSSSFPPASSWSGPSPAATAGSPRRTSASCSPTSSGRLLAQPRRVRCQRDRSAPSWARCWPTRSPPAAPTAASVAS